MSALLLSVRLSTFSTNKLHTSLMPFSLTRMKVDVSVHLSYCYNTVLIALRSGIRLKLCKLERALPLIPPASNERARRRSIHPAFAARTQHVVAWDRTTRRPGVMHPVDLARDSRALTSNLHHRTVYVYLRHLTHLRMQPVLHPSRDKPGLPGWDQDVILTTPLLRQHHPRLDAYYGGYVTSSSSSDGMNPSALLLHPAVVFRA
ncbi:hypothetical protein B0H19DRAFT_1375014 [Mycena capillaripes]|nr:hypothetical protein B0H19DRAFT_1375014 [Mycena capillaripes]